MAEKFEFESSDGQVFEFDDEAEMKEFAYHWSIGNLVAEGYGEIVVVDGESGFQINDKGRAFLESQPKG